MFSWGVAMSQNEMFSVDGIEYNLDSLSDEGRATIESLKFVEQEIIATQARLAVLNTAKAAYAGSLRKQISETNH